jgi:hypothetical protein
LIADADAFSFEGRVSEHFTCRKKRIAIDMGIDARGGEEKHEKLQVTSGKGEKVASCKFVVPLWRGLGGNPIKLRNDTPPRKQLQECCPAFSDLEKKQSFFSRSSSFSPSFSELGEEGVRG